MTLDRASALQVLVAYELPLEPALAVLSHESWDCEHPLVRFTARDVSSVLQRYLRSELTSDQVNDWADLLECREDIAPEPGQEKLSEVLFLLANPGLREPLTPALARSIEQELSLWVR